MSPLIAAFRFQLTFSRRIVDHLLPLLMAPMFTIVFLAITRHAGRDDLSSFAVLAPALIALWGASLQVAGEIIDNERHGRTLEALVAVPTSIGLVILGRVLAAVGIGAVGFVQSWLVAAVGFGVVVPIVHPGWFVAAVVVTLFATAATATIMAAVFVLARSARTFQTTLSYPFYVLGGVLLPVSMLPGWLEPVSRLVYLSWSSDLLRDSLAPGPVVDGPLRLGAIVVLGALAAVVGHRLLRRIVDRVRVTGTLGHA